MTATLLLLALRARREEAALRAGGLVAVATVVDSGASDDSYAVIQGVVMPVPTYRTVVEFDDRDGRAQTATFISSSETHEIGGTARVIYHPSSPEKATLLSSRNGDLHWERDSSAFLTLAAIFLVIAIVVQVGRV